MSSLWSGYKDSGKFYGGRKLEVYPAERIYEEVAFIAYYLHWSHDDIMALPNGERQRWCREISNINRKMEEVQENPFLI